MNYKEIFEKIKDSMTIIEFAHDDFGRSTGRGSRFIEEIGECQNVDAYGGEGKGEDWWRIKFFPDHDVYIKIEGFYSSYEGVEFYNGWDCCHEVKPKEKLVIVYDEV